MARSLAGVIANVPAERRARIAVAKRANELDRNLIAIAAVITELPIIAALAWTLNALAVGSR
jgi:hypothetical protein